FWTFLDVITPKTLQFGTIPPKILGFFKAWFALLCLQIVYGAFMAGLHAGLVYNTWPHMNGAYIPADLGFMSPWHINFFANIATVQFIHRNLAVLLALSFAIWWLSARPYVKNTPVTRLISTVAAILGVQFILGVVTLLRMAPLPLAWLHQLTGLILFAAGIMLLHRLCGLKYVERHAEPQ
ncbi:MAG: COX15/CtaA family protein, partial [Rickettsiales bacterium]|nr:COX15/CtaA family protein [Rickettsiales bacterium]